MFELALNSQNDEWKRDQVRVLTSRKYENWEATSQHTMKTNSMEWEENWKGNNALCGSHIYRNLNWAGNENSRKLP